MPLTRGEAGRSPSPRPSVTQRPSTVLTEALHNAPDDTYNLISPTHMLMAHDISSTTIHPTLTRQIQVTTNTHLFKTHSYFQSLLPETLLPVPPSPPSPQHDKYPHYYKLRLIHFLLSDAAALPPLQPHSCLSLPPPSSLSTPSMPAYSPTYRLTSSPPIPSPSLATSIAPPPHLRHYRHLSPSLLPV